jgi:hypothetical protein
MVTLDHGLKPRELQGLTKMDAEAALRKCNGDGDEALIYGVACLPDGAAEVEEREFSCPQVRQFCGAKNLHTST